MQKSTHTPAYTAVCAELRNARDKAGLSQRELAARLKVAHSWVAKVETGERRIDLVEFCWYLSACGADPLEVSHSLLQKILGSSSVRSGKGARTK